MCYHSVCNKNRYLGGKLCLGKKIVTQIQIQILWNINECSTVLVFFDIYACVCSLSSSQLAVFSCILWAQTICTSVNCTSATLVASCLVHSLRSLFLLFFVPQMSSDCLGLLLGLTLPLQPLSCHTGLTYLNETTVEHVSLFWICVKVLGVKVANGCLLVGNTMTSLCFLDAWWFSAFSLHFLR